MPERSSDVPIGTVLDWWRDQSHTAPIPLPEGYAICDGSVIQDPESPLNGSTLPDLNEKFVRGVTDEVNIGQTGGAKEAALPSRTGSCVENGSNPGNEKYKVRDDNQGWGKDVHLAVDGGSSKKGFFRGIYG